VTLTVVHITSKGLFPFTDERLRHVGQYDVLSDSLRAQTFTDFEIICVDASNPLPRPELAWWLKDRARFVRPRETPWRHVAGAWCAASARNTGLAWARGATVLSLDDCYELPPNFLERVAELATQGLYAWPHVRKADGEAGAYAVEGPTPLRPDEHTGGIVVYPLAAALACNGWDERWDGARYGEDWAFCEYMRAQSVRHVRSAGIYLVDPGRPRHVVGDGPRWEMHRCPRALWALAAEHGWQRANEPWTAPEFTRLQHCAWHVGDRCNYTALPSQCGGICEYPRTPTDDALRIMLDYESHPWFDLAAERQRNGIAA